VQAYRKPPAKGKRWVKYIGKWFQVPLSACFITAEPIGDKYPKEGYLIVTYKQMPKYYPANRGLPEGWSVPYDGYNIAWPSRYRHATLKSKHSLRVIYPDGSCRKPLA